MRKLIAMLALLAGLSFAGATAAQAADCCQPGAPCCVPGAPCCKK